MTSVLDYIIDRFQYSGSIFYWPYVLSCFLITFLVLAVARRLGPRRALGEMFRRDIWLSRSARTDVLVSLVYMLAFDAPTNAMQLAIFTFSYRGVGGWLRSLGAPVTWRWPWAIEATLAGVTAMLAFDLATYVGHRLEHKIPAFWDIHSVHHAATRLNLFSAYRQHPLDRVIRNSLGGLFIGTSMGVEHYFLPQATWAPTVLGIGVGFFAFQLTVHLQHSHVPVHYPRWLRAVLISPHHHQLHHSCDPRHEGKNLGGMFSIWDRLFGTYCDEDVAIGALRYGLGDTDPYQDRFLATYWYPFYSMGRRLAGLFARGSSNGKDGTPPSSSAAA